MLVTRAAAVCTFVLTMVPGCVLLSPLLVPSAAETKADDEEAEAETGSKKRVRVDEAGSAVAAEAEAGAGAAAGAADAGPAGAGSAAPVSDVPIVAGTLTAHVVVNCVGKPREEILGSLINAKIAVSGTVRAAEGW